MGSELSGSALQSAVLDIERFTSQAGWDQPARLFALVDSAEFRAAEPQLAAELPESQQNSYTCIEQDGFHDGHELGEALAQISWPPTVAGVAICLERIVVVGDQPETDDAALSSSGRRDIRLVVGVLRDGETFGVARLRDSEELVAANNLVPGLNQALLETLE